MMDHELEAHAERQMLDEIAFWGVHDYREIWVGLGCSLCGWYYHDAIHHRER